MKRLMGGVAILAALALASPAQAVAQQAGPGMRRGAQGPGMRGGVEMLIRMKDRLKLTDDQIKKLDRIRADVVAHRADQQKQMAELRSKVLAGEMKPDQVREMMRARREAMQETAKKTRERVDAVLTDAQRKQLEEIGGRARAFRAGMAVGARRAMRHHRMRGRGMRPGARMMRGRRPGFGAGMRGRMAPGAMMRRFRRPPPPDTAGGPGRSVRPGGPDGPGGPVMPGGPGGPGAPVSPLVGR